MTDAATDEYAGGVILGACPHCGQFCKVPDTYRCRFSTDGEHRFIRAVADSYCQRCQKTVELPVVFE
jgi:hypothetical protein